MDFNDFLPFKGANKEYSESEDLENSKVVEKISPNQFYDVITSRKPDWQAIIYDLINSEQLDPWDIDIVVLTKKYFEKIANFEESDFYVSSKVLLAAALLLRIKSEFLLNKHIRSIDDVLFGKKDENKYVVERIEINEDELPFLIPKTPLSRLKRVTLPELLTALNKAINTETRRIKREVEVVRARKLSEVDFPTFKRVDLKDRIKRFYAKIFTLLRKKEDSEKHLNKVGYSNLAGKGKEERISCFLPLLHLSNTQKLWLGQEKHLEEIWIYLYDYFDKNRDKFLEELEHDIDEMKDELETGEPFENFEDETDVIIQKKELDKEEKIEKATGFEDENF